MTSRRRGGQEAFRALCCGPAGFILCTRLGSRILRSLPGRRRGVCGSRAGRPHAAPEPAVVPQQVGPAGGAGARGRGGSGGQASRGFSEAAPRRPSWGLLWSVRNDFLRWQAGTAGLRVTHFAKHGVGFSEARAQSPASPGLRSP